LGSKMLPNPHFLWLPTSLWGGEKEGTGRFATLCVANLPKPL
jgi:hypothetical protein